MGEDVKALRERLKLTQAELATKLGVWPQTIRRWESGESKPSQLAQRQLARLSKRVK